MYLAFMFILIVVSCDGCMGKISRTIIVRSSKDADTFEKGSKLSVSSKSSNKLKPNDIWTTTNSYLVVPGDRKRSSEDYNKYNYLRRRLDNEEHKVFGHAHSRMNDHFLTKPGGVVVRLKGNASDKTSFYFLRNGKLREIPDQNTAKYLLEATSGNQIDAVFFSSIMDIAYKEFILLPLDSDNPVPVLSHGNPDMDIAFIKNKVQTLQNPGVINKLVYLTKLFHPCIIKIQSGNSLGILLSQRGWQGALREVPMFRWMKMINNNGDHNNFSVSDEIPLFGESLFNKEQIRMVELPLDCPELCPKDTSNIAAIVHLSYTHPETSNKIYISSMETSNLVIYKNGSIENTIVHQMVMIDRKNPYGMEKNWMPFVYNKMPYFVYKIFPLTIIARNKEGRNPNPTPFDQPADSSYIMDYVSVESCSKEKNPWEYGSLRGGTQFQLFPNGKNEFLGFFHSRISPGELFGDWSPISYFIGAVTFSASPPFKLTRISKWPIIDKNWYDGAWYSKSAGYIYYPMGFFFRPTERGSSWEIVLSMSTQEEWGYLVFINLEDLLNSMESVNC